MCWPQTVCWLGRTVVGFFCKKKDGTGVDVHRDENSQLEGMEKGR